ncbi:MAG: ShlB/FhaC/HecB family hemolysin secretion/activation protein [Pseudomonadota bacterium]
MSLMKLAPETVRLRRVAKAHALGEFSLSEYRQARREVIDNFEVTELDEDDTQPRLPLPEAGSQSDATATATEPPRRTFFWIVVTLLAIGGVVAATQVLAAETMDIPAVADRDPNPSTSRRLTVAEVRLADGEHLSELSLSPADLQAVIEDKLREIRIRNQPGSHGFTQAELEEVGRFLKALGAHNAEHSLTARDADDLSALLEDQKRRRGLSVVELEETAAALQAHLRDAGYFLAVAYLPAQQVVDGVVELALLPGVLGEVAVSGAGQSLVARFDDLIGKTVTRREINTRLYALNQAPGFAAEASFEPAAEVGESRLMLAVREQRAFRGSVALDNHGDDQTGRQRIVLDGGIVNLSGRGDVLSGGLLAAVDPDNQLLGYLDYALPVGNRRQFRARLARNDFTTGGLEPIDGDGLLLDAVVETFLHRDQLTGLSWELGLGRHELDWQTASSPTEVEQSVSLLSSALRARRVWDQAQVAADFRVYADVGRISGDTFAGQDDGFWDVGFEVFGWRPFDVPQLPGRQKVSLELRGQLAGTQLPSTRRLALGGIGAARGFDRDVYLADQGMFLRGDLRTPLALGELSLFADLAYGKDRNDLTPTWAHLANLGLAWDVRVGDRFTSSFSWAKPITSKGTGGLDHDGNRFFFSLRYAH